MRRSGLLVPLAFLFASGCAQALDERTVLTVSGSASGAEAEVLSRQIARFEALHPEVHVVSQPVPEGADERHQLYVQWLNARVPEPDILQLDVVWLQEFAAAGWLAKVGADAGELEDFLPAARESASFRGAVYGRPWFVDVGMLYYRKDWFSAPPNTFAELVAGAESARRTRGAEYGFVFQASRYEGLVTNFVEVLGGFGGTILDASGDVVVDSDAGQRALTWMHDAVHVSGISPTAVLSFQEEQARFAFQNGQAAFMRNWPYAYALMQRDPGSAVRGKVGIAPMPRGPGGRPTATLGGQLLAINASTARLALARSFIDFLCAPEQMLERARIAGQLPARRSVYLDPRAKAALPFETKEILRVVEHATARPPSPAYTELSQELQLELHRALTNQTTPRAALSAAVRRLRRVLGRAGLTPADSGPERNHARGALFFALGSALLAALAAVAFWRRRAVRPLAPRRARNQPVAYALLAPALLVIAALALTPLALSFSESLHTHDLRRPWQGRPFVGLSNYGELLATERLWGALGRTFGFTLVSVTLELGFGLGIALLLSRTFRGRGLVRAISLVPWAMPTVVVALAFRFLFDGRVGPVALLATRVGLTASGTNWFSHELLAWVPIVLSDVWKSSPFVALLLLAGLSNIPRSVYEAAAVDGAGPFRQLFSITLPMVRALLLVVLLFRALDAVRVFDLIYVLTHGGPGVATEPIALYIYSILLQNLDFGKGAALSVLVFLITLGLCLAYARLVAGREAQS